MWGRAIASGDNDIPKTSMRTKLECGLADSPPDSPELIGPS